MRLMTLLPMAADGVGPSYTCLSLLSGMAATGLSGPCYVARARDRPADVTVLPTVPRMLNMVPYRHVRGPAARAAERRYLSDLRRGDIAYLWPGASLAAFEAARALDLPVVVDGINTRMADARRILDAAYAAEGLTPAHGITDDRIRDEDDKLALTTHFFAPSPGVEAALATSPLSEEAVISCSYGFDPDRAGAKNGGARRRTRPIFLFVGRSSIRKGTHQLLRAWERAGVEGELWIAGAIEPVIRTLCAPLLERPDVRCLGFVSDVASLYSQADVFVLPSLEEGDPLVTLEAASCGLPVIASPMGAGRIGSETGCVAMIDPGEPDSIANQLAHFGRSAEMRAEWGGRAHAAATAYTWKKVAKRRAEALDRRLGCASARRA
ncbi:glycosyltransferase family 4 protein [Roseivivax marinus]|uniref:glycosyltransferase family 4 protein n=1 Tax=Roseivivax marinus TaxID=1379903 RepID=UPI001F0403E9|nr:glycosyltransferase family 4 protein [Roseivivax marinus]UMA63306.1 glycosyltransferase family 4 protein [Roseivivax marinus]